MQPTFLETLEPRIAPAVLVNNTVQFQDADGDIVTVEVNKGSLTEAVFKFDTDTWGDLETKQILQSIDLSAAQFHGASVTVSVGGEGSSEIGAIFAGDNKLGKVAVAGGLAVIEAGSIGLLEVETFGTTDAGLFDLDNGVSLVDGKLKKLEVAGDFIGELHVTGDKAGIGQIAIGGSMVTLGGDASAWIETSGNIGKISIGHSSDDGIDGTLSDADSQAGIFAAGNIGKILIAGDVTGGDGAYSGAVLVDGNVGRVAVGGTVSGGDGDFSGRIDAGGNVRKIEITGSLTGGGKGVIEAFEGGQPDGDTTIEIDSETLVVTGNQSGTVFVGGKIGSITIGGDITGGEGAFSGGIEAIGKVGSLSVGGNVTGGGAVHLLTETTVTTEIPAEGDPIVETVVEQSVAVSGEGSGSILAGSSIGKLHISGNLTGGEGDFSGYIESGAFINKADIGELTSGGIQGGGSVTPLETIRTVEGEDPEVIAESSARSGTFSGALIAVEGFGTIQLAGGLGGGLGEDAGTIQAGGVEQPEGVPTRIGKLHIGGDVTGTESLRSATVIVWGGPMKQAFIDGSIIGGSGVFNSLIYAGTDMGRIEVTGDILGGEGYFSGRIHAQFGALGHVTVGGELQGGGDERSGSIEGGTGIKSVAIGGATMGGEGFLSGSVIAGDGFTDPINQKGFGIGRVVVDGSMTGGEGTGSGSVIAFRDGFGKIQINGDLQGGIGTQSGAIIALDQQYKIPGTDDQFVVFPADATSISIAGGLIGASGEMSGRVAVDGNLKSLSIAGSVIGGGNTSAGSVETGGNLKSLFIDGDLEGSDHSLTGMVLINGKLNTATITGSILGGDNREPDEPDDPTPQTHYTGAFFAGDIGKLTVLGDIVSGTMSETGGILTNSGVVRAFNAIGNLTVGGSLIGNEDVPVLITGAVQVKGGLIYFNNNTTIGNVSIGEDVSHSLIVAGVGVNNDPNNLMPGFNPYAQIRSVTVGGDWHASSIASGVNPGPDGYGQGDTLIPPDPNWPEVNNVLSRIAKIVINGQISGGESDDQYGFVAGSFGKVALNGTNFAQPAPGGTADVLLDGSVKLHRVTNASL